MFGFKMSHKWINAPVVLFCLTLVTNGQQFEWFQKMNQLKILVDSSEQVEKLLGKPDQNNLDRISDYKFREGLLRIIYTMPRCQSSPGDPDHRGWNIPEHFVESVTFYFARESKVMPKDIKIAVSDLPSLMAFGGYGSITAYHNEYVGASYALNPDGRLHTIWYYPSKTKQALRCNDHGSL
jgi:hypothetical protein